MDMQETAILSLTYLAAGAAILIAGIGLIVFGIKASERSRRRRLVDSKRTIHVSPASAGGASCEHLRSKSRARQEPDGTIVSICKKCGARMKRIGEGNWEAAA